MNLKYNDSESLSSSISMYQAHLKISGRVQGVFYRAHARDEAAKLNLKGYIKNLQDGTVEAILQSPEKKPLFKFKEWTHQGSPSSFVHDVEISFETPEEPYFTDLKIY